MTRPITLLLTDDHAVVRAGVRALLETQPDLRVLDETDSGEAAVALAARHAPDVALVDLLMPGVGGIKATRRIKEVSPHTQVLILTSYHDDEHVLPALRAGALSYLLKTATAEELVSAIRKAARGEAVLETRIASQVVRALQQPAPVPQEGKEALLSERERETLSHLAEGLSNAEIARQLFISEKTVKSHVSNILAKLELADRTRAAVFAWREGLMAPRKK